jgi:hypothetical protein
MLNGGSNRIPEEIKILVDPNFNALEFDIIVKDAEIKSHYIRSTFTRSGKLRTYAFGDSCTVASAGNLIKRFFPRVCAAYASSRIW